MDEELVLVPHPTGGDSCTITKGDDPTRTRWICAGFDACGISCTAGTKNVWIKQSDMTRYLALRLVS